MASGPGSRAEEQPPALPVKQNRSHSSRRSSAESDCILLSSPAGLQHPNYAFDNVFSEPTDCHAILCPIHQRYDPSRHQVRFFSDGTPPPVPKKRFVRNLSLPVGDVPQASSWSPLQRHPHSFDNPLYMLTPMSNASLHEDTEEFSPIPFSQLTFDTPDEHLPYLFSRFDDQRVVSQGVQRRHLLFLRSVAQNAEARILLQAAEKDVGSYQPQDFLLSEGTEPKQIGDTVYYSLHSPALPGRTLGLRVHKQLDEASLAQTRHQPSHVNVRHVIAHFDRKNTLRDDSNISPTQDPTLMSHCPKPQGGGGAEHTTAHVNKKQPSVESFLQRGLSASLERDLPHATLRDFVKDSTDCLDYSRQVCALLLQILTASQHLYNASTTAAELRPQGIFLVWPNSDNEEGENKYDASETKSSFKTSRKDETAKKGWIQVSWRTHGPPRVVLTPLSSALAVRHPLTYIKSQIGALIQYCLHSQESQTSPGSGPTSSESSYRRGLLYLASLLQSESSETQLADMVAMLQVLLWGPRVPPFNHRGSMSATVHNWLTVKQALLVMKLAERGLIQDQSTLGWEDCMCLQYLSFADPETVVSVVGQLQLALNMDSPS